MGEWRRCTKDRGGMVKMMHSPQQEEPAAIPPWPVRVPLRRPDYDYSRPGYYFVTVCVEDRQDWFGTISNTQMHLKHAGTIVQEAWEGLPRHFRGVRLDSFVVMP